MKRPHSKTVAPQEAQEQPRAFGGLTVRNVVHYDFVLLRKLGSPLIAEVDRLIKGGSSTPQANPLQDEHGYDLIALFTMPAVDAAKIINGENGVENFRALAFERIGLGLPPLDVICLAKCIERDLIAAFSKPEVAARIVASAKSQAQ